MLRGYAVADVRAAEDCARAGLPQGELMLRAARGLAAVVADRAGERAVRAVVVLAGPGDNGGDALHAAGLVARRLTVTVVGIAEELHPGGLASALDAGAVVHRVPPGGPLPGHVARLLREAELVVDGLLGIGGRAGLRGAMADAVRALPEAAYVLAVDLPSGADPAGSQPAGRGRPGGGGGDCVRADETVTFGLLKPVHLLPGTEPAVGRLTVVDIGVEAGARPAVERLEPGDVANLWPVPGPADHKYTRGVVGVVAGSEAYPGAAVLCVTAAVEAGAGMVRYRGPRRAEDLVLSACPEVVPGPGRVQAAVVGPGIDPHGGEDPDRGDPQVALVREAIDDDVPLVVDAGGLQLLAGWLAGGGRRSAPTLLTPHAGELAVLLGALEAPTDRADVEADPVAHVRRAARLSGCTVLLKGSTTLVADPDPDRPVRSQGGAPPWLATAGSGDVLAGLCGVLLAAGLPPRDAGSLGALVHGAAAARASGGGPLRAVAVARALPATVAGLLAV